MSDPAILVGDPAPCFTQNADFPAGRLTFDMLGGHYLLMLFLPLGVTVAAFDDGRERLSEALSAIPAGRWKVLVVTSESGSAAPQAAPACFNTVFDSDHAVRRLYGVATDAPATWIAVSPAQRVIDVRVHAQDTLPALCAALAARVLQPAFGSAPAIVLPDILETDLCARLIAYHDTHDPRPSVVMTTDGRGKPFHTLAPHIKKRMDCMLRDRALIGAVQERIVRRVVPEIFKAFRFQATRMDRMLVSSYDAADGGFFAPHRDNTIASSAHRQFAVSITLNDGFTGGGLTFPEFDDTALLAPAGGAVVFSCALMHAVAPVTRGRRYAFLPFVC